jgi:hypothetical protein
MTIIIDIKPEVQAELSRQAAAHGVDIVAYARACSKRRHSFLSGGRPSAQASSTRRLRSLHSSRIRSRRFRMKPFHARVCIGITTDADRRCLPPGQ